jgi:hypothetical protein
VLLFRHLKTRVATDDHHRLQEVPVKPSLRVAPSVPSVVLIVALLFATASPLSAVAAQNRSEPRIAGLTEDEAGSLAAMLGRLPDLPLTSDGAMVTYANAARQAAALAISPPDRADDVDAQNAWVSAVAQVLSSQSTAPQWANPDWRAAFGFDLFQIDQAVEYAAPPLSVAVLRGRFNPSEMRAAWSRAGFQPIDLGAGEAYAIREDFAVDLADPGSRMALAHLNVVALADDGSLIFASTRDAVKGALAATTGQGPSFAGRPEIARLRRAAPADLVDAILIHGDFLQAVTDPAVLLNDQEAPEALATRIAGDAVEAQRLPPVAAALLGQTAGIFPSDDVAAAPVSAVMSARVVAVLAMLGMGTADDAATVIRDRLATQAFPTLMGGSFAGRPWTELFLQQSVEPVPEAAAVVIELTPAAGVPPLILQQMVFNRAPGFLAW